MRQQRRELSAREQTLAAKKLLLKLARNPLFRRARSLAFYYPSDGEISPLPLMQLALQQGRQCYLPVVRAHTLKMSFKRYRRGERLYPNRFGIAEPSPRARQIPAKALDVVLMPLVAFDEQGNRLGMGGGFYDRAFAKLRHRRPLRIGLAHSLQKVTRIEHASWDVPLHGICTERDLRLF